MNTTRADLVQDVAGSVPFSAEECAAVLECLLRTITKRAGRARRGREVIIAFKGFGRFYTKVRKLKPTARIPGTDQLVPVPARRVLLWKPHFRITFAEKGGPDGTD